MWNPVKELKADDVVKPCTSYNRAVESGEGIERIGLFHLGLFQGLLWNPVKELKG